MVALKPEQFAAAVRGAMAGRKDYNKIFCIGYNKTGTTTLELVLKLYGFHLPRQADQEALLSDASFSTDYAELSKLVRRFDAFQDMPFSQGQTYVVADALFPNSKFILSERDSEAWFNSIASAHKKALGVDSLEGITEKDIAERFHYLYPGYVHGNKRRMLTNFVKDEPVADWGKLYDKAYYIDHYERRNNEIKRYFMDAMDKLLIIDVTKEKTTQRICEFLRIPDKFVIDMPHENKTHKD